MNIYMHEVLDLWFETEVTPRLRGRSRMVRYADDAVILFERQDDAERVLRVLHTRFEKYGLTLHPEKTRLVPFHKPTVKGAATPPGTFTFLGFTFYWGSTRKGSPTIKTKTARERLSRTRRRINEWCRKTRHAPLRVQAAALGRKLRGHYAYYGLTFNGRCLQLVYRETKKAWRKWLGRRSQKAPIPWKDFERILKRYPLPLPRIVHSWWTPQLELTF